MMLKLLKPSRKTNFNVVSPPAYTTGWRESKRRSFPGGRKGGSASGLCLCAYACAPMHPGHLSIRVVRCSACKRVRACLFVCARVRARSSTKCTPCLRLYVDSSECTNVRISISFAEIPSKNHQHTPSHPCYRSLRHRAMVSQAIDHPFPRPPSLRVVSCTPLSRLASVSSRCAATGIRPCIHPSQRPLTFINGGYLRSSEDDACMHARSTLPEAHCLRIDALARWHASASRSLLAPIQNTFPLSSIQNAVFRHWHAREGSSAGPEWVIEVIRGA
jgi:hypothetical protein